MNRVREHVHSLILKIGNNFGATQETGETAAWEELRKTSLNEAELQEFLPSALFWGYGKKWTHGEEILDMSLKANPQEEETWERLLEFCGELDDPEVDERMWQEFINKIPTPSYHLLRLLAGKNPASSRNYPAVIRERARALLNEHPDKPAA